MWSISETKEKKKKKNPEEKQRQTTWHLVIEFLYLKVPKSKQTLQISDMAERLLQEYETIILYPNKERTH